ncbi:MAG: D-glycero-D-manno-heptose 1,7-bisphosphate phosphatase [Candidatus Azotimanducaceae bacterium]|jgi:D-glycero-D-manno-heptose 1,7-bisphosphate phosphatase
MQIVVLDRDGVINVDSADYIKSADEWLPLPGSIDAIAMISQKGYTVYVATNQAGLARGLFSSVDLHQMHQKLMSLVVAAGGHIEGIFFCPHHPDEGCRCRKPNPGLLEQIAESAKASLTDQPFVGDSLKDIQAAIAIGAKPVLVRTGNGKNTETKLEGLVVDVYDDLDAFARQLARI